MFQRSLPLAVLLGLVAPACEITVAPELPVQDRPSSLAPSATLVEAPELSPARRSVENVLDDWHDAAAKADGRRYFGYMAPGAVFVGTDASERWTKREFQAYAEPYFSRGQGWRYVPRERHVYVEDGAAVAWVDERLWNEKYGECRGTSVLRRLGDEWKIAHYTLSFPVPNDRAADVIELIRSPKE